MNDPHLRSMQFQEITLSDRLKKLLDADRFRIGISGGDGVRCLYPWDDMQRESGLAPAETGIVIPDDVPDERACVLPYLIQALALWDKARLELGEIAIFTDGARFPNLIALVANWRGALPVIMLTESGAEQAASPGIERISIQEPEAAREVLNKKISQSPGVAMVDFSGRPEVLDLLFETIPQWGRMILAAPNTQPTTVDFYNNVHRKCIHLCAIPHAVSSVFERQEAYSLYLEKALNILRNEEMAQACSRAVGVMVE